jgi:DNA polymerase-3 subunit epsilon
MEFDFHMIAADFYRTGMDNPLKKEMTFCTMIATTHLVQNPVLKFFKLGELYEALFHTTLNNQHDALVDAGATAECFFELVKRGEITDESILDQQRRDNKPVNENKGPGCAVPMLFIISLIFLLLYYI